jgi:methionine-gamma-lyase
MTSFATRAVHAGDDHDKHFGSLSVPVYPASVFAFPDADTGAAIHNEQIAGYYYGRLGNPTVEALEQAIAELESADAGLAFASGMAAISGVVLTLVQTGGHIIAPESGYSTTMNLFRHMESQFGVKTTFVDATDADNYRAAVRPSTSLMWIETPSNPLLQISDIKAITEIAQANDIFTAADNTFATPFNQRPHELGADLVVHSATKYLGGHSDLTAGMLTGNADLLNRIYKTATKLLGGNIAPAVAWLVLRGIKTLPLRMERHNSNAYAIADMLSSHPKVERVYYPGIETHRNQDIARRQMSGGFGGMVAFDVGSIESGKRFSNAVRLCTLATSLGGVETIVQHSASMTHATLSADERRRAGISDGLIRLSVGIEAAEDIIDDLDNALKAV